MTDDQISKMALVAELTVINSGVIMALVEYAASLQQQVLPLLPEDADISSLSEDADKLKQRVELLINAVSRARHEFDIE
jgi:hypothetical protein